MRAPLTVRINDGRTDRLMSKRITGLRWRKTAPGGHADASCRIDLPSSTFTDLGPADRMWVYDNQARTMWEGYTNNPGTQSGRTGQGFDLSALGGMSLASDRRERLIYIDWSLERWRRTDNLAGLVASSVAEATDDPILASPALRAQFTPGTPITNASKASFIYDGFQGSTQTGAGIGGRATGGLVDANYEIQFLTPGEFIWQRSLTTTPGSGLFIIGTGAWVTPRDTFYIHLQRVAGGATTPGTDAYWGAVSLLRVVGSRVNRSGATVLPSNVVYILASEVVEDVLGRILTFCDPGSSSVAATTFQIDQLAYFDAVSSAGVLEDLSLYEPNMLWEILESGANGLHRFNYRAWPTTPRYILPPSMPIEQPGGDVDLCNRIAVNWTDIKGNPQVTVVTSTVPELGTRIRDADSITLPEGRGSLTNAQQIGAQILASKADPPKAGKAVVDRPIMDLDTGSMVYPWEIQPGYLVRDQASGEDYRLTEMEYDDDSCAATLSLGDPVLTIEQRVAHLSKVAAK